MGGCLGIHRQRQMLVMDRIRSERSDNVLYTTAGWSLDGGFNNIPLTRKNNPLCHEPIRWKSDVPLTEGQLKSKRDEFWDTAPAFDGKVEIWNALKVATSACESLDFELAQAILDGAGITIPSGYLIECYDELGTRYHVPVYCLSYPINIVKDGCGTDSPTDTPVPVCRNLEPTIKGVDTCLKLRLSTTCQEIKLPVVTSDSVAVAKKKLQEKTNIDPANQRWFFGGKLLSDRVLIEEANILPGYVIQVAVKCHYETLPTSSSTVTRSQHCKAQ